MFCRGREAYPFGLVFEAHRLGVSLNSRLGSNKEEENGIPGRKRKGELVGELRLDQPVVLEREEACKQIGV